MLSGLGGAELAAPANSITTNETISRMKTSMAAKAPAMERKNVFISVRTPFGVINERLLDLADYR